MSRNGSNGVMERKGGGRRKSAMTGTEHIRQIVGACACAVGSDWRRIREGWFGCDRDSVSFDSRVGIVYSEYRLEAKPPFLQEQTVHRKDKTPAPRHRKRQAGAREVQGNAMITFTGLDGSAYTMHGSAVGVSPKSTNLNPAHGVK